MKRAAVVLLTVWIVASHGCAPRPGVEAQEGPAQNLSRLSEDEVLSHLRARAGKVRTISGEGSATLRQSTGQTVRLDAALAMEPPNRARVRAWKLGRAVLDLTLNDDGLFLYTPDDPARAEQLNAAGASASRLARSWALLAGGFYHQPDLTVEAGPRGAWLVRGTFDGNPLVAEVDRRTLNTRAYRLLDPSGQERFTLTLDRYQATDGVFFPRRATAKSAEGEIRVDLRTVDLNSALSPDAFRPARRAQRVP